MITIIKIRPNWIGYARVSTTDQHLARQLEALHKAGVPKRNIYQEKISGAHASNRPQLQHMLKDINHTNVVAVLAIDRLGRNYTDIKDIMAKIKAKGAKLVILNLPITKKYVQSGSLISILDEFMIDILAYQADHERKAIRARQAQGIASAKKRGVYKGREVKFGRENKELQGAFDDYFNRDKTHLSVSRIAKMHGMSRITLYRKLKQYKPRHYEEQFNFQRPGLNNGLKVQRKQELQEKLQNQFDDLVKNSKDLSLLKLKNPPLYRRKRKQQRTARFNINKAIKQTKWKLEFLNKNNRQN